jgi:hypothetical protein
VYSDESKITVTLEDCKIHEGIILNIETTVKKILEEKLAEVRCKHLIAFSSKKKYNNLHA